MSKAIMLYWDLGRPARPVPLAVHSGRDARGPQ